MSVTACIIIGLIFAAVAAIGSSLGKMAADRSDRRKL